MILLRWEPVAPGRAELGSLSPWAGEAGAEPVGPISVLRGLMLDFFHLGEERIQRACSCCLQVPEGH